MAKISIIVPIFNTGDYIVKCLNSICSQTLEEIEIILIDDGSTDNSGLICDEYAAKDGRIIVIHKSNEGVSVARNTGIMAAKSAYIGFIDSDDWIEPDMLEKMLELALLNDSEIVICDAVTVYCNNNREIDTISKLPQNCKLAPSDLSAELLVQLAGSVWRCIYKKSMLIENSVLFPVGLKFSEDRVFNILAYGFCHSIFYDKTVRYNRLLREGSAVNRYYENMIDIVKHIRETIHNAIDLSWKGRIDIKKAYETQNMNLVLMAVYNEFHRNCTNSLTERYKNIKNICNADFVRESLSIADKSNYRVMLINKKMALILCVIAIIFNIKHRR